MVALRILSGGYGGLIGERGQDYSETESEDTIVPRRRRHVLSEIRTGCEIHQQNAGIRVLGWPALGSVREKRTQCAASR